MQLERSEITTAEIIYVLGTALNLDDTEMSYVLRIREILTRYNSKKTY